MPDRQIVADVDRPAQSGRDPVVAIPELRFYGRGGVEEQKALIGIVQNLAQAARRRQWRVGLHLADSEHGQTVLGHRKRA